MIALYKAFRFNEDVGRIEQDESQKQSEAEEQAACEFKIKLIRQLAIEFGKIYIS